MFGHTESTVVSQRPWAAIVAAGVAGVMLGLVIGVPWGRRTAVVPPAAVAAAVTKPADTEVPVAPEPPPRASRAEAAAPGENDKKPVAKGPGRIVVRSTPAGAMLLIDGRPHGQTPATVKDLPLGTHTIDVARPGYVPHTERITLSAGRAVRTLVVVLRAGRGAGDAPASATGTPAASLGSIYVDSRPRGARVMIDGRFVGTSPLRVSSLRPGEHSVELDLTGHRLFSTKVALKASEQARVTATLEERNEY